MTVVTADILLKLSGGSSNADPNGALGGAKSSVSVSTSVPLNNLFDNVSDAEAVAGDTEYRCVYIVNTNGTDTLNLASVYITSNTPSADDAIQIGLDPAGVGDGVASGVATVIANENTAPTGVTFTTAANLAAALAIGTLTHGQSIGLWFKRIVQPAAEPVTSNPFSIRVTGTPA